MAVRNKGFEEFLPLYQSRHAWSDRAQPVEVPLFPGYVFCRFDLERRLSLLTIPGVLHFVGVGKTPIPIDGAEIAAIQAAVQREVRPEPWPFLDAGSPVRLAIGPLAGLEGFLVEVRNKQRIVVSVTLLKRSVAVEIERSWLGRRIQPEVALNKNC